MFADCRLIQRHKKHQEKLNEWNKNLCCEIHLFTNLWRFWGIKEANCYTICFSAYRFFYWFAIENQIIFLFYLFTNSPLPPTPLPCLCFKSSFQPDSLSFLALYKYHPFSGRIILRWIFTNINSGLFTTITQLIWTSTNMMSLLNLYKYNV